jgi:diguanylate cyclase
MVIANARVSFKAGETIMRQGEPGDSAYIIESGRVEILFEKPDGRQQRVGTRGSDTMIGEMALVDDAPRTATVRAIEDCTLLQISKHDFSRRLHQADPVLRMTAQVILNRYRDMLTRAELTGPEPAVPAEAREVSNVERQRVIECVRLTNEFRDALHAGELELYYQPIVATASGEIHGFEALMRWQHATRGFISPAVFIPVAEASGLIVEASLWVLDEACAALKRIEAQTGRRGLFVSVNLSSADFASPGIVDRVHATIRQHGIEPHQLHLEITERMLMDQPERARCILEEFHQLGVPIAIDDFGTGYSSLSYLHSLHIDVLKIDRSFVAAMRSESRSLELVRAIIGLSRNLGIKVIAEGVEVREEAVALAGLGCEEAQGYYYARPLPERDVLELFSQEAVSGW